MENQPNINHPEAIPVSSASTSRIPLSPSNKTNFLIPLLIMLLLTAIVFGFGGYYLGSQVTKTKPLEQNTSESAGQASTSITMSSPSPAAEVKKITLSDVLSNFCLDKRIALEELPFSLSQSLKNTYNIQTTIDCYVPDESYASISKISETPDFSVGNRFVYFYHQNSTWIGQGNTFQPLTNYKPVTIDGQDYWLDVLQPGPYGISTQGVWIDVIGEKKDNKSGTIVRVIDNEILKDEDLLDIVKKYGVKQTEPSFPEYIITDPAKKKQFVQEIESLASQHKAFKTAAQNVTSDLNGVSF